MRLPTSGQLHVGRMCPAHSLYETNNDNVKLPQRCIGTMLITKAPPRSAAAAKRTLIGLRSFLHAHAAKVEQQVRIAVRELLELQAHGPGGARHRWRRLQGVLCRLGVSFERHCFTHAKRV
jgi:hypothetical protein